MDANKGASDDDKDGTKELKDPGRQERWRPEEPWLV